MGGLILICGFGPFPGVPRNPSAKAALAVARRRRPALSDWRIEVEILPTLWTSPERLVHLVARHRPSAILLLGVARRRRALCLETLAVNAAGSAPDAARRHGPAPLLPGAPPRLSAPAATARLLRALRSTGLAARLSRDAGRYLCNAVYFRALHGPRAEAGRARNVMPVVFVHLPGRSIAGDRTYDGRLSGALSAVLVELAAAARPRTRP